MMRLLLALILWAPLPLLSAPLSRGDHAIIMLIADSLRVPRSVADRLQIEEAGDPGTGAWGDSSAISHPGTDGWRSRGLYQISTRWQAYLVGKYFPHPSATWAWDDPIDSAVVGLGYLAALHRQFGTWERALWFYNCGRVTNVPSSTQAYAGRIVDAPEPKL